MNPKHSQADEILSVLSELTDVMADKLFAEEEASEILAETVQPIATAEPSHEGSAIVMFSERFPWVPSFGDFPITVWGPAREIPSHWMWTENAKANTEEAMAAIESNQVVRIVGSPGTGKTELWEIMARLTGREWLRLLGQNDATVEHLVGELRLNSGNTDFKYGVLPMAMARPTWICFDELTAYNANVNMAVCQPLLEPAHTLPIPDTNELLTCHPGVVLCGADNARGLGDNGDKFPTRQVQDVSTLNRWNVTLVAEYMTPDEMARVLLNKYPKLHKDTAKKIGMFAAECQEGYAQGNIPLVFSMRQAFTTVENAIRFKSIKRALQGAFLNSLEPKDQETVLGIMNKIWSVLT